MTNAIWQIATAMWGIAFLTLITIQTVPSATKSPWVLAALYLNVALQAAGSVYLMIKRKIYETDDKEYYERKIRNADETMAAILKNTERFQGATKDEMLALLQASISLWGIQFSEFFKDVKDGMPKMDADEIARRVTDNTASQLRADFADSFSKVSGDLNNAISSLSIARVPEETQSKIGALITSAIQATAGEALEKTVRDSWDKQIVPAFRASTAAHQEGITNIVRTLMEKHTRNLAKALEDITRHVETEGAVPHETIEEMRHKGAQAEDTCQGKAQPQGRSAKINTNAEEFLMGGSR